MTSNIRLCHPPRLAVQIFSVFAVMIAPQSSLSAGVIKWVQPKISPEEYLLLSPQTMRKQAPRVQHVVLSNEMIES